MATVAELEARLDALKAQRDSAVARVSYDGRSVEYRGTAEIARAIAELERELQMLQGKAPVTPDPGLHLEGSLSSEPVPAHRRGGTAEREVLYAGETARLQAHFVEHPNSECFTRHKADCIGVQRQKDRGSRRETVADLVAELGPPCND